MSTDPRPAIARLRAKWQRLYQPDAEVFSLLDVAEAITKSSHDHGMNCRITLEIERHGMNAMHRECTCGLAQVDAALAQLAESGEDSDGEVE